jgi:hypothetical protein
MEEKYFELDKQVSEKIIKDFKGQIIESVCWCKGMGCEDCNHTGKMDYQY